MSQDRFIHDVIVAALCGIFFWFGYKKSEKDTIEKMRDMTKDLEIQKLKRQIDDLRLRK